MTHKQPFAVFSVKREDPPQIMIDYIRAVDEEEAEKIVLAARPYVSLTDVHSVEGLREMADALAVGDHPDSALALARELGEGYDEDLQN